MPVEAEENKVVFRSQWGSIQQKRYLNAARLGKLVRAIPRVSVEPVMVVLSGPQQSTD